VTVGRPVGRVEHVLGPFDGTVDAVAQLDAGPVLLHVDEPVVGDVRETGRSTELDQLLDRAGGRGAGVEPAGEGDDDGRGARPPGTFPHEVVAAVHPGDVR
jgi:hypothetical protein